MSLDLIAQFLQREDWQDQARCRKFPGLNFFTGRGEATAPVKKVCAGCPGRPTDAERRR